MSEVIIHTPRPKSWVVTIPTSQWTGSDNDYYITVNASNITPNSILIPNYDINSTTLINGTIWCVPADGSFTIHTNEIPNDAITVIIQLPATMGEADYQVLSDTYSKDQADLLLSNKLNKDGDTMTGALKVQSVLAPQCIELTPPVGASNGGYIDYHYGGENIDCTSRIIENMRGVLNINGIPFNIANPVIGVDYGGTGGTTASEARTNLDVPSTTGSGASGTWNITIPFAGDGNTGFKNFSINAINIDNTRGNWEAGFSERENHGTFPSWSGWCHVRQFDCEHFLYQTANSLTNGSGQVNYLSFRGKYVGDSSWGPWTSIFSGWNVAFSASITTRNQWIQMNKYLDIQDNYLYSVLLTWNTDIATNNGFICTGTDLKMMSFTKPGAVVTYPWGSQNQDAKQAYVTYDQNTQSMLYFCGTEVFPFFSNLRMYVIQMMKYV